MAAGTINYLTPDHVFESSSMVEILNNHMHDRPVTPSSRLGVNKPPIDKDLELLILQCLEKKPSARPASAASLRAAMAKCESASTWTNLEATAWWRFNVEGGSSATEVKEAAELQG